MDGKYRIQQRSQMRFLTLNILLLGGLDVPTCTTEVSQMPFSDNNL